MQNVSVVNLSKMETGDEKRMKQFTYVVTDEIGIHARPAGLLVKEAKQFQSTVMLGPARAVLFIVVAQIAAAYLVELFGLFGVEKAAWEWRKAIGLAVAAVGIAVFQWK